jgi:hypothetical protein
MADEPDRPRSRLLETWREINLARTGAASRLLQGVRVSPETQKLMREVQEAAQRLADSPTGRAMAKLAEQHRLRRERELEREIEQELSQRMLGKRKRKKGGGRKPKPPTSIEARGIAILQKRGKQAGRKLSLTRSCEVLEAAGINVGRTTVYQRYWKPAFGK